MTEKSKKLTMKVSFEKYYLEIKNSRYSYNRAIYQYKKLINCSTRLGVVRFGSIADNLHDVPDYLLFWL